MNPQGFFGELKRRNVYKVAVAYAIVGWLMVQIATQITPPYKSDNRPQTAKQLPNGRLRFAS